MTTKLSWNLTMSETNPEQEIQSQIDPLQKISVQVDTATKEQLLQTIKQKARQPESVILPLWKKWYLPAAGLAAACLVLVTLAGWQNNWWNLLGAPETLTIRTKTGSDSTLAQTSERMGGGVETFDVKSDYFADERARTMTLSGNPELANWRYPDVVYQVTYARLEQSAQDALAEALDIPIPNRTRECETLDFATSIMPTDYSKAEQEDCIDPAIRYSQGSRQLYISSYDGVSYVSFESQGYVEGQEDSYFTAQKNYANLTENPGYPGAEEDLLSELRRLGLISSSLSAQLSVVLASNHLYTCPVGESYSWSPDRMSEFNAAPDICVNYGEDMTTSLVTEVTVSSYRDTTYLDNTPTPTGNRPRVYASSYVLLPSQLAEPSTDTGIMSLTIDHNGKLTSFFGKIPKGIKALAIKSATPKEVINLINQGELKTGYGFGMLRPMIPETTFMGPDSAEVLTDKVEVNRISRTLIVFPGQEGEDYFVPAFQFGGTIQYDQPAAERALRADQVNRERCVLLQQQIDQQSATMDEITTIPPEETESTDIESTRRIVDAITEEYSTDLWIEGEGSEGSGEWSEPGYYPGYDPETEKLYEEFYQRQCYLYESSGDEQYPFSEAVTAFPGLKIEQGE